MALDLEIRKTFYFINILHFGRTGIRKEAGRSSPIEDQWVFSPTVELKKKEEACLDVCLKQVWNFVVF